MSVRQVQKSYSNVTGIIAARRAKDDAGFGSSLEKDFFTLQDFDPTVEEFEVQPVVIPWIGPKGERRTYTPDCLAHPVDNKKLPTLFEVKYRKKFWKEWPKMRPKYRAAIHYAVTTNRKFRIVTEKEIRTRYLVNARFLLPIVRRTAESLEKTEMLLSSIAQQQQTTPNRLLSAITSNPIEQALFMPTLWRLIGTFRIGANLWQPLTMESNIWSMQVVPQLGCLYGPAKKLCTWDVRPSSRGSLI
jgi:TnsA endonuclease N terminal